MSRSDGESIVDLGISESPPSHDQLTTMLHAAQKHAGRVVRLQWKAEQENCKFYLQAQTGSSPGNSVPVWTLKRLVEEDLSSLSQLLRGDSHLFQLVTGDVGLLLNLIWSECTGTNQDMDTTRNEKAFDLLNYPLLRDSRSTNSLPAMPAPAAPNKSMFESGVFTAPRFDSPDTLTYADEDQGAAPNTVMLSGDLSEVELTGVLQSIKICNMVGRLDIRDRLSQVEIFFEDGEVVHAVYSNAVAGPSGDQAVVGDRVLLDVLTWDRGNFFFNKARKTSERTIKRRLDGLLLEGAGLRDYCQFLRDEAIDEDTVLETTKQLTASEVKPVLENGVAIDVARQVLFYLAIDGKATVREINQRFGMSRIVWLPIVFNILNCRLAAPLGRNKGVSAGTSSADVVVSDEAMSEAARQLARPDTGLYSFPLFMHFLKLEFSRCKRQYCVFTVVLFECKNKAEPISQLAVRQLFQCFDTIKGELDILGHYGDHDFAVLMPLRSAAESKKLMKTFAASLAQTDLDSFAYRQDLHVAFGCADQIDDKNTIAQLLKDSEEAKLLAIKQKVTGKTISECRWERLKERASTLNKDDHEATRAVWSDALIDARRIGESAEQVDVTLKALAEALVKLEDFGEAEICLLELLKLRKAKSGSGHNSVLEVGTALMKCYCQQGKVYEAERVQHETVRNYLQTVGNEHPQAPDVVYLLVKFYRSQGDFKKASAACKTVVEMSTAIHGAGDPKTASFKIDYDELRQLSAS